MRLQPSYLLVATLCSVLATACADDSPETLTGTANLSWQVGARGCAEHDVNHIRITQREASGTRVLQRWDLACAAGRATLVGVRPGRYVFEVEGRDHTSTPRWHGASAPIEVRASGETVVPTITLTGLPATVEIRWNFGGPFCSHAEVARVEVKVFDTEGFEVSRAQAACETGTVEFSLRAGLFDVSVEGLNSLGVVTHSYLLELHVQRGEQVDATVTLEKL